MTYSATLKIQPNTLTDLTVIRSQYGEVKNTLSLSDFTVQNDYLESNINFIAGDEATISSTGYQTQTITVAPSTFNNAIVLVPLEFSNIETNSIKYYCKDEVARNSITSITTDLNNKAGTDLANVTNTGKVLMSGMGLPSNKYIDLTLGASGSTYTAPANGWVNILKLSNGVGQYMILFNMTKNIIVRTNNTSLVVDQSGLLIPVNKNDIYRIDYSYSGTTNNFKFIYAQGSESEA